MSDKTTAIPTDDQYFLLVGGRYNGERIKLETNEIEELIQVPDQLKVGFTLDEDLEKGKIIYPQIYKYDYNEKHYIFVENVN